MSKKIIAYISFSCSEDFEDWQEDHPENTVIQVMPILSGIELTSEDIGISAKGTTNIAVFVTYC